MNPYRAQKQFTILHLMNLDKRDIPVDLAVLVDEELWQQLVMIYGGKNFYIPTKREWVKYNILFMLIVELANTPITFSEFVLKYKVSKHDIRWYRDKIKQIEKHRKKNPNNYDPLNIKNLKEVFKKMDEATKKKMMAKKTGPKKKILKGKGETNAKKTGTGRKKNNRTGKRKKG